MGTFADPLHDEFAGWILGFAPYGGGDVGEIDALAAQVVDGDDGAFYDAFAGWGRRLVDDGDAAERAGHVATARDCFLRAAAYLGVAYHPLYGTPVDGRLVDAFHLQTATFERYLARSTPAAERVHVPYESTEIPAWLLRTPRFPDAVRPTILVGGGWDSTMVENHLGMGVAALARGYHVLLHDGPGQGQLLIDEGLTLRHDWEHVVTPVLDAALGIDVVDPDRVVYQPWSLGGYMAPRVAAFEHRLAAVVADPGQLGIGTKFVPGLRLMGLSDDAVTRLPELDPEFAASAEAFIASDRSLNWALLQRAQWANGVTGLPALVAEMWKWELDAEILAGVECPILVLSAEGDRASADTDALFDLLPGPKTRIHFTAAEGAGMHCELLNRSLANRRILDWLDDTLGVTAT
jgi:pimeloyl-ACP methyl ester carboxylesterase